MDNFARSSRNMFVAQVLDRAHNLRKDDGWMLKRRNDPGSWYLPVWQSKVLIAEDEPPRPVLLKRSDLIGAMAVDEAIFLGEENGVGFFAVNVGTSADGGPPAEFAAMGRFRDLRGIAPLLSKRDGSLLAYAKVVAQWHSQNHFCSVCGSPTRSGEGGHFRLCTARNCGAMHFPRTDPAIIVLIRLGDKCLLGRQAIWPERRYSVIAGFVEAGESAEAAVIREAREEAGVHVKEIYYHSSQPWPFPCSLMLGFTAKTEDGKISLGDKELEDARWFSRQELRDGLEKGTLLLPTKVSIAYQLIEDWFNEAGGVRLCDLALPEGRE